MSRTIRRKNAWDFDPSEFVRNNNDDGWTTIWYPPNSQEYKIEKSKYPIDKRTYNSGVPHWYTNLYTERPFRQQTRTEIHIWMKNPDELEIMTPEFRHDVGWDYW